MASLPDRPVGVRRSWRKITPDLAFFGERLRLSCALVSPDWGDPVEAQEFRERKGALRRVVALYGNGRRISLSYRRDGTYLMMSSRTEYP